MIVPNMADEIATVHAGVRHDRGVDRDDVGHRRKGGRPGDQFLPDRRAALGQMEKPIDGMFGRCRLQRRFDARPGLRR
jgi:hypothetical protein